MHSMITYNHVVRHIQFQDSRTDKLIDERPTTICNPAFHLATRAFKKFSIAASRLWKAAQLVEAGHVHFIGDPMGHDRATVAEVRSQSSDKTYYIMRLGKVEPGSGRHANHHYACTCYDYRNQNAPVFDGQPNCKHILAASMQDYISSHDVIQQYLDRLPAKAALKPGEIADIMHRNDQAYRSTIHGQRKKEVFQLMDKIGTPEGDALIAKAAQQPQPF